MKLSGYDIPGAPGKEAASGWETAPAQLEALLI